MTARNPLVLVSGTLKELPAGDTLVGTGTMAAQNANNVAITGGAVDGAPVGGTTAAAGTFTTLHATGNISADVGITFGDSSVQTTANSPAANTQATTLGLLAWLRRP